MCERLRQSVRHTHGQANEASVAKKAEHFKATCALHLLLILALGWWWLWLEWCSPQVRQEQQSLQASKQSKKKT